MQRAPPPVLTPRQWRISVDGRTTVFGTAAVRRSVPVLSAHFVEISDVVVSGWSTGILVDPAAVLSADLLAQVVARLTVRERLHCAALSRAWRRVVSPASPAVLSDCVWQMVDLAFLGGPGSPEKLSNFVLPRWGSHIRQLSVPGTWIDDDGLRAVATGCPHLHHLDVRDCERAFRLSCEQPNVNSFSDLLLQLYGRALPLKCFTLLMRGCGFASGSVDCGDCCEVYIQAATNLLDMVYAWPVKPIQGELHETTMTPWLQCDVAMCNSWGSAYSENCNLFAALPVVDGRLTVSAPGLSDYEAARLTCDFCKRTTCKMCFWSCDAKACAFQVCGRCYEDYNGLAFCDCCHSGEKFCLRCINNDYGDELCPCCADEVSASIITCGCGYSAIAAEFEKCSRCHELSGWMLEAVSSGYYGTFARESRNVIQCCACRVVCCSVCDPNPDGVGAGVAASDAWSGPFVHPQLLEYSGCTFCCSRPEACSGLADFLALAQQLEGGESSGDDPDCNGESVDNDNPGSRDDASSDDDE